MRRREIFDELLRSWHSDAQILVQPVRGAIPCPDRPRKVSSDVRA